MQTITIKVALFSKENSIKKEVDLFGQIIYKIRTTAKPKDGEANESVIKIIAEYFKVAKRDVRIVKGLSSIEKVIEVG
ncbi:MAG: DUF167 domain-containing protein [Alphaproteobacteria bacterium]|nr:DUF167 domain-containing protein [Rickettsiales bacterium]